jgi:hypothetical protein
VPACFSWKSPQVFRVHPKSGQLEPNEACRLRATFSPDSAKVYSGFASCTFGCKDGLNLEHTPPDPENVKIVEVEGIGKYPYVTVKKSSNSPLELSGKESLADNQTLNLPREVKVDFGCVAVGHSTEKWIVIENPSPVSWSGIMVTYHLNQVQLLGG